LQAKAEGTYTIPAAKTTVGGKTYQSNTVTIKVVKQGTKPAQNNNSRSGNQWGTSNAYTQPQQPNQEITSDDIFIRMHVDKTNIYQGEPIVATLKIYTRLDLVGFEDFVLPEYNGFWVQEFEMPSQISLQRETVNGVVYNTAVLKKDLLFPQYSGNFEINPAEVKCIVRQRTSGGQSPWDAFFGYYENKSVSIKSPTINIIVKPLPDNAPGYFSGAVGNFTMKTEISSDTLQTNDALTLKLIINGTGNLKLIDPPNINFPDEFEVFEPEVNLNVNNASGSNTGSKTFDYTLIPRYPGDFTLNNIRFAYFDPSISKYKSLQADAIHIFVKRGINDDEGPVSATYTKENVEYIGDEDIHFIASKTFSLSKGYSFLFGSFLFFVLLCLPAILFSLMIIIWRKRIRESANIAKMRNKKANKVSMKRLRVAREHMQKSKREAFYKEVMTALWGYLGDKLDISVADLSKDNVSDKLKERAIEEKLTTNLIHIIELCEFAHFAPVTEETKMQNIYNEAVAIINQFEQKLK
jgi:hypothetical protein